MAKREPRWVKVFLKQLERTGNVRLAAEGAGVDYTTAYQRRKAHADFAERWEQSLEASSARVGEELALPPLTLPPLRGGSLPLPQGERGLNVHADGKLIKASDARWSKRAEARFLTELTVSGSVRLAARAAGFSTTAVYKRRLKDRHFAAAWEAAIETGRVRLQASLVEAANRTFDPEEWPVGDEGETPKVSVSEAINIAKLGNGAGSTRAGKGGWGEEDWQFVTNEELDEARERIYGRLQRIQEHIAYQEATTGCCHNCGQRLTGEPGQSLYQGPIARYFLLGPGRF